MDWNDIVQLYDLNYLMGNPPFVWYSHQSKEKKPILRIFMLTADCKI